MSFAQNTSVSIERSKAEIEKLLKRYGATTVMSAWDREKAAVAFTMHGRAIRMLLPLPKETDPDFKTAHRHGYETKLAARSRKHEQELRRRWRAFLLVIKAKLEAVESGIVTFEEEWLAHFVLPGGKTVGQLAIPEIERAYASGEAPKLLLEHGENAP
jgi:hypothetical protein